MSTLKSKSIYVTATEDGKRPSMPVKNVKTASDYTRVCERCYPDHKFKLWEIRKTPVDKKQFLYSVVGADEAVQERLLHNVKVRFSGVRVLSGFFV